MSHLHDFASLHLYDIAAFPELLRRPRVNAQLRSERETLLAQMYAHVESLKRQFDDFDADFNAQRANNNNNNNNNINGGGGGGKDEVSVPSAAGGGSCRNYRYVLRLLSITVNNLFLPILLVVRSATPCDAISCLFLLFNSDCEHVATTGTCCAC
jgi:hypothetical protein